MEKKVNFQHISPPGKNTIDHNKKDIIVCYLCVSFGGDWNKVGSRRAKKVQKREFLAFLCFLHPLCALNSHSKILHP